MHYVRDTNAFNLIFYFPEVIKKILFCLVNQTFMPLNTWNLRIEYLRKALKFESKKLNI